MKPQKINFMPFRAFLLLLPFVNINGYCQNEIIIESKITDVTVFLSRAQITRDAEMNIADGKSIIVFNNLPARLDEKSIQVKGIGNFTILGVSSRINYLNKGTISSKLKELNDSLKYYEQEISIQNNKKNVLLKEENMLLENQKIGSDNHNLIVSELKEMADFFRLRLTEISSLVLKQDNKLKSLNEIKAMIEKQINQQIEIQNRDTKEIVIALSAKAKTKGHLTLNYVVSEAGWKPIYDFRALSSSNRVVLNYKAQVFQMTGEEWNDVHIKLSTANPSLGATYPELPPQYVDFFTPALSRLSTRMMMSDEPSKMSEYTPEVKMPAQNVSDFTSVDQSRVDIAFDISLPYSVLSSKQTTLVDIQQYEMTVAFNYIAVPKLDTDAYLVAQVTGWENFNLLSGEANIFFDGTFVSKTFIDPKSVKDTFMISLVKDKRIIVKREKKVEYTSRKIIGTNIVESIVYEISVRNTKTEPIMIQVIDQIPVSKDNRIEIENVDFGEASEDRDSGELRWNWKLSPNETKSATFKFGVKYPKGKEISGL